MEEKLFSVGVRRRQSLQAAHFLCIEECCCYRKYQLEPRLKKCANVRVLLVSKCSLLRSNHYVVFVVRLQCCAYTNLARSIPSNRKCNQTAVSYYHLNSAQLQLLRLHPGSNSMVKIEMFQLQCHSKEKHSTVTLVSVRSFGGSRHSRHVNLVKLIGGYYCSDRVRLTTGENYY